MGRDAEGRIVHLNIRAGEQIVVPKHIAAAYKRGYTPVIKDSPMMDVCLDFGVRYGRKDKVDAVDASVWDVLGDGASESIDAIEIIDDINEINNSKEEAREALRRDLLASAEETVPHPIASV